MAFNPFPFKNGILALLTLISIYIGRQFFITAWEQLRQRKASMNTLVSLSVSIAFLYSLIVSIFPLILTSRGLEPTTYFESAAMIIAFVLTGHYLEDKAKKGTADAVKALTSLQPETVRLRKVSVENGMPVVEDSRVSSRPRDWTRVSSCLLHCRWILDH